MVRAWAFWLKRAPFVAARSHFRLWLHVRYGNGGLPAAPGRARRRDARQARRVLVTQILRSPTQWCEAGQDSLHRGNPNDMGEKPPTYGVRSV